MAVNPELLSLFTEQAVQKNRVTDITIRTYAKPSC